MSETSVGSVATQIHQFDDAAYVQLVKETVCPKGTSDVEFRLFMAQAKRSGLDPLIGQCFCVSRKMKQGQEWVTKNVFQPAESGMLARAEEFPDFEGITGDAVYEKDTCVLSPGDGTVDHQFSPCAPRGNLVGAWARVCRKGKVPVLRFLELGSRIQTFTDGKPMGLWGKNQADMITKCARAAVLRIAYPAPFGGLYISGEIQEHEPAVEKPVAQVRAPEKSVLQIAPPPNADVVDVPVAPKAYKDMTNNEKVDYWCAQFAASKTTGELDVYSQSLIAAELSGGAIRGDAALKAAYSVASARLHREGK